MVLSPHPSNLPSAASTPQVWFGNWFSISISDTQFIPPTGGTPLSIASSKSEQWYSIIMPGPATFIRMTGYRIPFSLSAPEIALCDFHFRVNGIDKAILTSDLDSVSLSITVNKGDLVSVKVTNIVDFIYVSVGLALIPHTPDDFYYCGGTGIFNAIPTLPSHWVKRPALSWKDFVVVDAFGSEFNTPAKTRSVISTKSVMKSCLVRIHNSNSITPEEDPVGPFIGTCNIILIKGRGSSEEIIGQGQIVGNGQTEILMDAPLQRGDLVSFAFRVDDVDPQLGTSRPGLYYSCVVHSQEPGWFMLGNGHEFEPSIPARIYPLTESIYDQGVGDHPFRSIIPVDMNLKNWQLSVNAVERGPAVYRMHLNNEPSNLNMSISVGMIATSSNGGILDKAKAGDLIHYTAEGDNNFFNSGFAHMVAAKVGSVSNRINLTRGSLPPRTNPRNV